MNKSSDRANPPRLPTALLRRWGHPDTLEEVEGDLLELYAHWVREAGAYRANVRYTLAVLRLLRPLAQSKQTSEYPTPFILHPAMIRTNFLVAWRNFVRSPLVSSINVVGLALGMACSLIIWLWVRDELSINRFYPQVDQLFFVRLYDGQYTNDYTSGPIADALKKDVPQVVGATKFTAWSSELLVRTKRLTGKETGQYVSGDFFNVFGQKALQGDPGQALASPNAIIIDRSMAERYFGTVNAVGQTLQLDNKRFYRVGAVIEDMPKNATIQFNWLVNLSVIAEDWMNTWNNNSFRTYVRLAPNTTQAQAERVMKTLPKRYKQTSDEHPILQPVGDMYLYDKYENGQPVGGRIGYVWTFGAVALLILVIACVNFTNLATARSATRGKEVGVRKAVGAMRSALVGQFMSEMVLFSLLSVVLALGITFLMLPVVNQFVGKQLALNLTDWSLWASIGGLVVLTSLLAGSYPAFFLSAMRPVQVLKGKLSVQRGWLRKGLVVFQFGLSLFLIVGMLIIGRQMQYIRTKQLGLDRQNLIRIPIEGELRGRMETYRQMLLQSGAIQAITTAGETPVQIGSSSTGGIQWPGKDPKLEASVYTMKVGYDFTRTMGIRLLAGRDITPADSGAYYLINESAAKMMNLPNPVGTEISYQAGKGRIAGVMQDFHLRSMYERIEPLVLTFYPQLTNHFLVKTGPGQLQQALAVAEQTARKLNPGYPFVYHFVDEDFEALYRNETLVNTLLNYFGGLAIFISCLGLFGLATFTAEQRTKEIGVRKVLGASVTNIVALLSKDFLKLVGLAIVVASPLAWWAVDRWLQHFIYRIDLNWWVFALAGALVVLVALLTISFQSIRAALMNPVQSLRSE